MSVFSEIKTRVKNTFIEIVEDEEVQPKILKSKTDSLAPYSLRLMVDGDASTDVEDQPPCGAHGFAAATAFAATSTARTAAHAVVASVAVPPCLTAGLLPVAPSDVKPLNVAALLAAGDCADTQVPTSGRSSRTETTARSDGASGEDSSESALTTIMLRNLPNDLTRNDLLALLDSHGFAARYDFVYLPVDFSRRAGLGYAFVNMASAADARRARTRLEGFRRWRVPSAKVCSVGWSNPTQGLRANVERYRSSPVMHASVPDAFKPILLVDGRRAPFPGPTKKLRRPEAGGRLGRARA